MKKFILVFAKGIFGCLLTFFISDSSFAQITPTQMLNNGKAYSNYLYTWTASTSNINNWTSGTPICGGRKVYCANSPAHGCVVVGTNWGMPYCWGGCSNIAQHNTAMSGGRSAGDVCWGYTGGSCDNTPGGAGTTCASGMDCSGFVQRCWLIPNSNPAWPQDKLGTPDFKTYSIPIEKPASKPGDIYLKSGSHVRLIQEMNYSLQKAKFSESAKGSIGLARVQFDNLYDNTSGTNYAWGQLSSYTAYRFNNSASCISYIKQVYQTTMI